LDELSAHTVNARNVLNALLDQDRNLHDEMSLLEALERLSSAELEKVDDVSTINEAIFEAEQQMATIKVTKRHMEALKDLYKAFKLYDEGNKTKALDLLRQHVKDYSHLVVDLVALEEDPNALRDTLRIALLLIDHPERVDRLLPAVMSAVVAPAVALHCSTPMPSELEDLLKQVQAISDARISKGSALDSVIREASIRLKEAENNHRRRLGYRSRVMFMSHCDAPVQLRKVDHSNTGAEWEGFKVEEVKLQPIADDGRSACRKAFDSFDIDCDGKITIEEVVTFLLSVPPEERPRGLHDVNPFQKKKMRLRVQKIDTNRDGLLSLDEFTRWWEKNHGTQAVVPQGEGSYI